MASLDPMVALTRRLIDDTDPTAQFSMTDAEIILTLNDALNDLTARLVGNFPLIIFDTVPDSPTFGVTPQPTVQETLILCTKAALVILRDAYAGRLKRGELGVSWRSGPEEESSIAAARSYNQLIDEQQTDLVELMLIYTRLQSGQRMT